MFTDTSTDSDGSVLSRSWTFGDGGASTEPNPSHPYAAAGTYDVTLTVTDNGGLTGSATQSVTVTTEPPASNLVLTVTTCKAGSNKFADLAWTGGVSTNVDVYRDGKLVITTANDGAYSDKVSKTTTSATYQVCEPGSTTDCSNIVTVNW